jgi:2,3-dihydroxybenzoate decarboxylase
MTSRIRKIALEEHFMTPGFEVYSQTFTQHFAAKAQSELYRRLADVSEVRLREMDKAGIEIMVLSQTGPGVQAETNPQIAACSAARSNDFLADAIARHPDRFAGFAALPMHSPNVAADELVRAVTKLGLRGAMVHGHTLGTYYDSRAYDPFWEAVQRLDVPLYLHPTDFPSMPASFDGHPELSGAVWGWGVETGTHALRLLFGGVFDRFPGLKIILGHMGEGLPFYRWRFDSRFAVYPHGVELGSAPSTYFGRNIFVTTTGVCSPAVLDCVIAEIGTDAVLFSVDYPYESIEVAADFIERASLDEESLRLVCHGNAERLLKLPGANVPVGNATTRASE